MKLPEKAICPVVEAVCEDLRSRAAVGYKKYGTTLARQDLELYDWLQHAYEEALDHANYLKRAMQELEKERFPKLIGDEE